MFQLTNEITAANNKIFTNKSSNCSRTSCQIDFPVKIIMVKMNVICVYLVKYLASSKVVIRKI